MVEEGVLDWSLKSDRSDIDIPDWRFGEVCEDVMNDKEL